MNEKLNDSYDSQSNSESTSTSEISFAESQVENESQSLPSESMSTSEEIHQTQVESKSDSMSEAISINQSTTADDDLLDRKQQQFTQINNQNESQKKSHKKFFLSIGIIVAACAVVVIAFVIIRGPQPKKIKLEADFQLYSDASNYKMQYKIYPKDVKKNSRKLKWSSSDTDVLKVNQKGQITPVSLGDCYITATTVNGKKDKCHIWVVRRGPDLEEIYDEYCNSSYATLADDNSSLEIDTAPYDDGDYVSGSFNAVIEVNKALELPDSILTRMDNTRAVDGTQSYEGEFVTVTWTYHPDNGLEVVYSLNE